MTYTPDTERVRSKYAEEWIEGEYFGDSDSEYRAEFDRWLAEYTRQQREEAWAEGYAAGQDSVYTSVNEWPNPDIKNPHRSES